MRRIRRAPPGEWRRWWRRWWELLRTKSAAAPPRVLWPPPQQRRRRAGRAGAKSGRERGRLRFFTEAEVASVMGFPARFSLPHGFRPAPGAARSLHARAPRRLSARGGARFALPESHLGYRMLGNSLSVTVLAAARACRPRAERLHFRHSSQGGAAARAPPRELSVAAPAPQVVAALLEYLFAAPRVSAA